MKKARKMVSALLAVCLLLTAAPLSGLAGLGLFSKAQAYAVGDHIQYGNYPQSRVTDTALIANLDAAPKTWKSYRYYSGTGSSVDGKMAPSDYMQFADFFYGGNKYRAVTFSAYRPEYTGDTQSASNSYQDENGYAPNNLYYFLYEPIDWRILDPTDGLILSEMILDSQAYQNTIYYDANSQCWQDTSAQTYASDYATCSIRDWLNYDFYETAFSDAQKNNIRNNVPLNNNSLYSNVYNSVATKDKIFLLSYDEAKTGSYGFSSSASDTDAERRARGTDYAQCQGLHVYRSSGSIYDGSSWWWLRSPYSSYGACIVYYYGHSYSSSSVYYTYGGVRAACRLANLQSEISQSQNLFSDPLNNITSYTVTYHANGGTGAPAAQTKTEDVALTLSSAKPTKSYTVSFNANGGSVSTASKSVSCTFKNWNTSSNGSGTSYNPGGSYTRNESVTLYAQWTDPAAGTLPTPTRTGGYTFAGWYTSSSGGTQVTSSSTVSGDITLYAHWNAPNTYTVAYHANGGTGIPSQQTKTQNVDLVLSDVTPRKSFVLSYNANGGSVSPASKTLDCAFRSWNTKQNGGGASYRPGGTYSQDEDVTLYAQWTNPTAGSLATPTRSGYNFMGWYTAASGGTQITSSYTVTSNMTLYARWSPVQNTNIYNLGEETYGFVNFGDGDSPGGHCFGMSVTSAAYYLGLLDIKTIGGNAGTSLNSFTLTERVKAPICNYQKIQGSFSRDAIVVGGNYYKKGVSNIYADWDAVVDYVKNHEFDNTGALQIGFRKTGQGGHAINFLRYENVNGQDRIYAYDNNFPNTETYFYMSANEQVLQAPAQTFTGPIDCIALRDIRTYMDLAGGYDSTRALYAAKDSTVLQGYAYTYMEGELDGREYVMYEIPAGADEIKIIPREDYADFIYLDTEYSFGEITPTTYGVLRLETTDEHGAVIESSFKIYDDGEGAAVPGDVDMDGKVTASDARLALRQAVNLENYAEGSAEFLACDVDRDGKVTANDARSILRAAVGLEELKVFN